MVFSYQMLTLFAEQIYLFDKKKFFFSVQSAKKCCFKEVFKRFAKIGLLFGTIIVVALYTYYALSLKLELHLNQVEGLEAAICSIYVKNLLNTINKSKNFADSC